MQEGGIVPLPGDDGVPPDSVLVAAARQGSMGAFTTLVQRHYARVWRFVWRLTAEPDLARDLTQATFVVALQNLASLEDDQRFGAWLYGIARNVLRMEQRHWLGRIVSLDALVAREEAAAQIAGVLTSTVPSAAHDLVQEVLAALRAEYRQVLVLHLEEGFSLAEIALLQGISPSAARKRFTRAAHALRTRYDALQRAVTEENAPDAP